MYFKLWGLCLKSKTTTTIQNSSTLFSRVLISIVSGHLIQRENKSRSVEEEGAVKEKEEEKSVLLKILTKYTHSVAGIW